MPPKPLRIKKSVHKQNQLNVVSPTHKHTHTHRVTAFHTKFALKFSARTQRVNFSEIAFTDLVRLHDVHCTFAVMLCCVYMCVNAHESEPQHRYKSSRPSVNALTLHCSARAVTFCVRFSCEKGPETRRLHASVHISVAY